MNIKFKQLVVSASLTLASLSAHAIVNLEQAIIGPTKDGFHSRVDLLASGTSGNTENKRSKVDLLTLWQHERHTEFMQLQYAYGTSLGVVDTDNAFAHFRHRTQIEPLWGVEDTRKLAVTPLPG